MQNFIWQMICIYFWMVWWELLKEPFHAWISQEWRVIMAVNLLLVLVYIKMYQILVFLTNQITYFCIVFWLWSGLLWLGTTTVFIHMWIILNDAIVVLLFIFTITSDNRISWNIYLKTLSTEVFPVIFLDDNFFSILLW